MSASPQVRKALISAIKTQIKTNTPPETKQAFMRLLGQGISERDVYIHLAKALASEMFQMMKYKREHDKENFAKLLSQLPDLD